MGYAGLGDGASVGGLFFLERGGVGGRIEGRVGTRPYKNHIFFKPQIRNGTSLTGRDHGIGRLRLQSSRALAVRSPPQECKQSPKYTRRERIQSLPLPPHPQRSLPLGTLGRGGPGSVLFGHPSRSQTLPVLSLGCTDESETAANEL